MLETWMDNGRIGEVRCRGGRGRHRDHNTNIQIQKKSFLTPALQAQVSKKNNPISVKQGFYSRKKYAFNQNSYGILFSLGIIEWLIISMHSTVSPT